MQYPLSQPNWNSAFTRLFDICHDGDTAIAVYKQYLNMSTYPLTSTGFLWQLADECHSRFDKTDDLGLVNKALSFVSKAIDQFPEFGNGDIEALVALYHSEGLGFCKRFKRTETVSDIEGAIQSWSRASDLTDDGHVNKLGCLGNLAAALQLRFERLGDLNDIGNAIDIKQRVLDLTADGHADRPSRLANLGNSLTTRFEHLGLLADINRAISVQRHAVDLAPNGHANKPFYLNDLGISLERRFERLGDLDDIENAISILQEAVDLTPDGHAEKPSRLNNLGSALQERYNHLGRLADIDTAIIMQQKAADLTSDGHPDKPLQLNNLGISLATRFGRLGELADIDNAISAHRHAVDLTPDGHAGKPSRLNNLGSALETRFESLGQLADINNAVSVNQQGVDLTPNGHAEQPGWLNNLGNSLQIRFKRLKVPADIDKAISIQRQAVDLTPEGHALKPTLLNNLGTSLQRRFQHMGDLTDIDDAISVYQQAVNLTLDRHTSKISCLNNLGDSLRRRFERLREVADIDMAISINQQAVNLTADSHVNKPLLLYNLAQSFYARYEYLHSPRDISSFVSSFSIAAKSIFGPAIVHYQAARRWAALLHPSLDPYRRVIELIPGVIWLGKTVQQRYQDLDTLGDAVMEAASAACIAGNYDLSLEWLEQGRAIVWGQILHLRSPVNALQESHPKLARQLNTIAAELETAGTSDTSSVRITSESSLEEAAQAHRRLAEKWGVLLKRVRALPGFDDFLQPKPASLLKTVSHYGTIVVINISRYQSDAFILKPASSTIGHVQLIDVTLDKLEAARDSLFRALHSSGVRARGVERKSTPAWSTMSNALTRILAVLWSGVAKPILGHLGYMQSPPIDNLPHITWCLTGPLASLPLHAAGVYDGPRSGQDSKIFNYVVSSYTPSLTALLQTSDKAPSGAAGILAITQAATPGLSPLPGTIKEVDEVAIQIKKYDHRFTRMDGDQATVVSVSEAMNNHNWVHFSCHAKQDAAEPTKSAFHLHDNNLELAEIMKKPLKHAKLAYLSACQTATGDAKLPDEAVHLAAGMFIAGYRSVVATLWSIKDDEAPLVAREFYNRLLNNPEGGIVRALHEAVKELRKQVGGKDFISWVLYIHMGH